MYFRINVHMSMVIHSHTQYVIQIKDNNAKSIYPCPCQVSGLARCPSLVTWVPLFDKAKSFHSLYKTDK